MAKQDPTRGDDRVTLTFTRTQIAHLRELLFEEIHERADVLGDQAHEAHESGGDVIGIDAEGTYRSLRPTAELLDIFGWDTAGDIELLIPRKREQEEPASAGQSDEAVRQLAERAAAHLRDALDELGKAARARR